MRKWRVQEIALNYVSDGDFRVRSSSKIVLPRISCCLLKNKQESLSCFIRNKEEKTQTSSPGHHFHDNDLIRGTWLRMGQANITKESRSLGTKLFVLWPDLTASSNTCNQHEHQVKQDWHEWGLTVLATKHDFRCWQVHYLDSQNVVYLLLWPLWMDFFSFLYLTTCRC